MHNGGYAIVYEKVRIGVSLTLLADNCCWGSASLEEMLLSPH
jgi:hypothetical protein